jgi:putative phosphoribosyl transferase
VALEIASALNSDLELLVCRKIPLPLSPEGGFGAITDDGTMVLNDEIVRAHALTPAQIDFEASRVRENVKQRTLKYRGSRPLTRVMGRTVIIVDDGLATGVTMMAAVESVRYRRPKEIVVAVPIAHQRTAWQLGRVADSVVTCATADLKQFFLADFYRSWREYKDDEILRLLEQWQCRQNG